MNYQENPSNWILNTEENVQSQHFMKPGISLSRLQKPLHLFQSWANPVHAPFHINLYFNIISRLSLGLPSGLLPSCLPTKTLCAPLLSPIRAKYPAHLILLDFITRTVLGEEYRSLNFSLCSFLHFPVTSSLLGPNILHSALSSNTISLVPPPIWNTKFHTHSKQQAKL